MTEVPTTRHLLADQLWATTGGGARTAKPIILSPVSGTFCPCALRGGQPGARVRVHRQVFSRRQGGHGGI